MYCAHLAANIIQLHDAALNIKNDLMKCIQLVFDFENGITAVQLRTNNQTIYNISLSF